MRYFQFRDNPFWKGMLSTVLATFAVGIITGGVMWGGDVGNNLIRKKQVALSIEYAQGAQKYGTNLIDEKLDSYYGKYSKECADTVDVDGDGLQDILRISHQSLRGTTLDNKFIDIRKITY